MTKLNQIINNPKLRFWLEVALVIVLAFVVSNEILANANPQSNPPGRDGGFFLYAGKAIKSGATLYSDIWDSKGPLIFWINALGVGSNYSRFGVFLIELIFSTASFFIVYWIIKKEYGFIPAVCAILFGSGLFKLVIGQGNFTEEYSILFTWISIAALWLLKNRPTKTFLVFFMMGFAVFMNFLLRVNNIGTQIAVIAVAFASCLHSKSRATFQKGVLGLLVGLLSVAIPTSLYFIYHGTFKAMIEASIIYNFAYSTVNGSAFSNSIQPAISLFGDWIYVLAVAWVIALIRSIRSLKGKKFETFLWLTVLAFPIEVVMSSISGRGYGHYFICWIPICMLLISQLVMSVDSIAIEATFRRKVGTEFVHLSLLFVLLLTGASISSNIKTVRFLAASMFRPNINREYQEPSSRVFSELTEDTDKILVFGGQAGVNMMAHRDSINAALFYPLINNSKLGLDVQERYFERLQEESPTIILDGYAFDSKKLPAIDPKIRQSQTLLDTYSANLDLVLNWINENYERFDEANGFVIYRLKENP